MLACQCVSVLVMLLRSVSTSSRILCLSNDVSHLNLALFVTLNPEFAIRLRVDIIAMDTLIHDKFTCRSKSNVLYGVFYD